jgi:fructuronate reductase
MTAPRLASLADAGEARTPAYDPAAHGPGIVHLGLGAFHKAHQAAYTDAALAAAGGDWRIIGVSLRGTAAADALNPQNGLCTLIERGAEGVSARLIASIAHVIAAAREPGAALDAMCDPAIRIVSLTVTEKAYGIDRAAGALDLAHPAIAADLKSPHAPSGALGLIVEALRRRHARGLAPFTVLCCDNLPANGALLRSGVLDFARRATPDLVDWIASDVAFPATMVDRITPAPTAETLAEAARLTGHSDLAAVETEPFTQWVIEDRFPAGRPQWETGGALFVTDVAPYEAMKLRMLNGAHSMLAYAGFLSGRAHVRDVMADPALARLVARHLAAAAATLDPLPGVDFAAYAGELQARFRNPAIAHQTYQIAMDGTEKLPQRLLHPAEAALSRGGDIRPFAFAIAAWMRYCLGRTDAGEPYALRDPREDEITAALAGATEAADISTRLHALPNLIPERLAANADWRAQILAPLDAMLSQGVAKAVEAEAAV